MISAKRESQEIADPAAISLWLAPAIDWIFL